VNEDWKDGVLVSLAKLHCHHCARRRCCMTIIAIKEHRQSQGRAGVSPHAFDRLVPIACIKVQDYDGGGVTPDGANSRVNRIADFTPNETPYS